MRVGFNGHSLDVSWKLIASVLGAVVLASGAITAGADVWDRIGWQTPARHAEDIGNLENMAAQIEITLSGELRNVLDEFKCGELDTELRELLREQRDNPNDTDLAEDIRRLRDRIGPNGLNCQRFD